MLNRPRCRDWTALATQQLRLRNLVRIIGHNISCGRKCQLYFTLHSSAMSAPFFTSEKVTSHGSGDVEWSEITSQAVLKSTARCVCIRVWEYNAKIIEKNRPDDTHSAERISNVDVSDRMLFVWGVYFSGLVSVTRRSDITFLCNSLTFQMHGGYFASPETLTVESIRHQLAINYEQDQCGDLANICSCDQVFREGEKRDHASKISSESFHDRVNPQPCMDNEREFEINSPRCSRSCSPATMGFSCVSITMDMLQMLRTRYLEKWFLNSEIRSSYDLNKLLYLQEKQRKCKKKNEHAREISEKICMKSAFCLNLELISSKRCYQRRGNLSMGRTLNRLLFEEPNLNPEDIMKGQELKRQIEQACFRCQILLREKEKMRAQFHNFEKKLGQLHDKNVEQEFWLMSCYRKLNQEKESLVQGKATVLEKSQLLLRSQMTLRRRRVFLCRELQKIYPISRLENGQFTINNIFLPNTDHLINNIKLMNANHQAETPTPISLSVALGYVAHVVHMCCVVYDIPPRNPIKHEGSRSRILDVIKDVPNTSSEFPLYCRASPLPKPIFYAIYLLNQNIVQLNFQIYSIKCDTRETLLNLLWLLNGKDPGLPDLMLSKGIENHNLSTSESSIDLNMSPPSINKAVDIEDRKVCNERLSRSVGSYAEEQLSSDKSFRSSEPILSFQQQTYLTEFNENCNI